jgi:hypothetical protein
MNLRLCAALGVVAALAVAPQAATAAARAPSPTEPGIEAAFASDSYAPGGIASLRFFDAAAGVSVQVFHAGPERMRTRRPDVMNGVAVTRRAWIGRRWPGSSLRLGVGVWESGLYYAKLTSTGGLVGYAPFIVRPGRLGEHRIAAVLPTQTWQAYNFRDDDGDGVPDTWYASSTTDRVRLDRPFLDRGVPYRFRHYDLPFVHWLARTGKHIDFLTDGDLARIASGSSLAAAYDLIVFPGHHEYVTAHEYDLIERYRDLGGNLAFLFANDFFWQVVRRGETITRTKQWRALGRPEAALIGVGYRANDRGESKGPWVIRDTTAEPWLYAGTRLVAGSRIGSGGIEIDSVAQSSPADLEVLAAIPHLYGPRFTAEMTYYTTPAGAKVFAAGAFDLVESVFEPDAPLPDPAARRNEEGARRMLENLWRNLATP